MIKTRVGLVVSDKMNKTRVVAVVLFRHTQYQRVVKRTTRFKAHDEKNESARRGPGADRRDRPCPRTSGGG